MILQIEKLKNKSEKHDKEKEVKRNWKRKQEETISTPYRLRQSKAK